MGQSDTSKRETEYVSSSLKALLAYILFFLFASSFVVAYTTFLYLHVNLADPLDASTINGIIAATAILFGFVSVEARKIQPQPAKIFFFIFMILFLIVTCEIYFSDVMYYGHATKLDLLVAMDNLFYNAFSYLTVIHFTAWSHSA